MHSLHFDSCFDLVNRNMTLNKQQDSRCDKTNELKTDKTWNC